MMSDNDVYLGGVVYSRKVKRQAGLRLALQLKGTEWMSAGYFDSCTFIYLFFFFFYLF